MIERPSYGWELWTRFERLYGDVLPVGEAAAQAAAAAAALAGPQYAGAEEWGEWEEWEEEGEYEYASYDHGAKPGQEEVHAQEGLLYQPLEAVGGIGGKTTAAGLVRVCESDSTTGAACARYADFLALNIL